MQKRDRQLRPDSSDGASEDNTAPSDADKPDSDADKNNPETEQPLIEESPAPEEEPLPEIPVEEELPEKELSEEIIEEEVFLYVEFQQSNDNWIGQYIGAPNQMIVTADGNSKDAVMTLDAGIDTPSYGAYRLFGALSDAPDEMWSSADGIEVNVAFTFSPLESPEN